MTRRARWIVAATVLVVGAGAFALYRSSRRAPAGGGDGSMAGMAGMSGSADGSVRLTTAQLKTFGVTYATVEQRTLGTSVRTVGTVMVDESRMASVSPKFDGFVERLYVSTTGQPVRRGQALADVYSPALLAAQEELLIARRLDGTIGRSSVPGVPSSTASLASAARRRLRLLDVSDAQINEVLRTGRARRTVTLYSPASGVITEKKVVVGQAVQAGMELYAIADLSSVWVDAQVRETEAADLRVGSGADLEFATYPGRTFKGRVTFIYPTLAEQTRSIRARISVANSDGQLRPGMYATVRLSSPTRTALTVPRSAVVQTGERAVVFVEQTGGALRPVDVETGRTGGEYVEILAGLEPGQRVVTSAQFLLDSESNLAEVMKGMMGMGGGAGDMAGMDMGGGDMKGMDMKGASARGKPGATGAGAPPAAPR